MSMARLAYGFLVFSLGGSFPVVAATIPVTTNSDTVADDGSCSLREAIAAADADTASGSSAGECPAGSGRDTITIPPMQITVNSSLAINSSVDIVGAGAGFTIVDGNRGFFSVFLVNAGQVSFRGIRIQRGNSAGGGGIFVATGSAVDISDTRITDNTAASAGGGIVIQSGAMVTVARTTIDGNESAQGGGVFNSGVLLMRDSLVGGDPPQRFVNAFLNGPGTGNVSTRQGAIANTRGGVLNLRNTTISGNVIRSEAGTGGLFNAGFAFLNNVTMTKNMGAGNTPGSFRGAAFRQETMRPPSSLTASSPAMTARAARTTAPERSLRIASTT